MTFNSQKILIITSFLFLLLPSISMAASTQHKTPKPYVIQANRWVYYHKQHRMVYLGQVIATQGKTHLYAQKMIIRLNKKGKFEQVLAYGNPARYQGFNANQQKISAQAEQIHLNPKQHTVLLLKHGRIDQNHDIFTGPHIWYDIKKGIVKSNSVSGEQPTVIIMQPQQHSVTHHGHIKHTKTG